MRYKIKDECTDCGGRVEAEKIRTEELGGWDWWWFCTSCDAKGLANEELEEELDQREYLEDLKRRCRLGQGQASPL